MQTPEGPTSLMRVVSGIVPGGVEKDPQDQHVEGWFLRIELKFALERDRRVRGDARGGCSFFCNGILASVLPRPGLHPCEQMAVRNFMLKFAILSFTSERRLLDFSLQREGDSGKGQGLVQPSPLV